MLEVLFAWTCRLIAFVMLGTGILAMTRWILHYLCEDQVSLIPGMHAERLTV